MAQRMNKLTGKQWLQNSFSIWREIRKNSEEKQLKHPAMYPIQLCEKLIEIYTHDDGEVILDPFMGVGSTIIAARNLNRKGIGIDLSKEFYDIAEKRIDTLFMNKDSKFKPELHCGDSRKVLKAFKDSSIDFCVNSPPYWDILNQRRTADNKKKVNYSDSKQDVGNIDDYHKFLLELKKIYSEVYRVLKPNKRCCVIVMDIRKKDKFFPLHIDISNIMSEIGFELEEFVIWDRQHEYNNMKTLGYPYVFRFNKVHEFVCVFWKR